MPKPLPTLAELEKRQVEDKTELLRLARRYSQILNIPLRGAFDLAAKQAGFKDFKHAKEVWK